MQSFIRYPLFLFVTFLRFLASLDPQTQVHYLLVFYAPRDPQQIDQDSGDQTTPLITS